MSSSPSSSPGAQPDVQPASAGRDDRPNTRFGLRAMFLLLVICAVVASLYRFSGYAFVIVGIPILVHTVASYMLHGLKWSGWFCLGLGMLTATLCALGCIIYDNIRAERTNDITDWAADILLAILTGTVAGFIPYILEFWVRLVFDSCVWIGRLVTGWGK